MKFSLKNIDWMNYIIYLQTLVTTSPTIRCTTVIGKNFFVEASPKYYHGQSSNIWQQLCHSSGERAIFLLTVTKNLDLVHKNFWNPEFDQYLFIYRYKDIRISSQNCYNKLVNMAIPVVEFSREGYKIRKVFG